MNKIVPPPDKVVVDLIAQLHKKNNDLQSQVTQLKETTRDLNSKNLKLEKQIGKLKSDKLALNNRIKVLEEENSKKGPGFFEIIKQTGGDQRLLLPQDNSTHKKLFSE